MNTFVTRIAATAALALAALPVVAVGAAHAQTRSAVVAVSDLDFARTSDIATFEQRVGKAAAKLCRTRATMNAVIACEKDVAQQAKAKLGFNQTQRMITATAPARAFATAAN